jgi:hypothetical protein
MAKNKPREFFDHENQRFNISEYGPIPGTEVTEDGCYPLVRSLIGSLAASASGIEKCITGSFELDASDYSIYIAGTPVDLSRMDGEAIGYSVIVSIYPTLVKREYSDVRSMDGGSRA